MPIEILIAPAAPAAPTADSVSDLVKYGVPVGTLILGIVLKAAMDEFSAWRKEKKAAKSEAERRKYEQEQRVRDRERENLLHLLPLLTDARDAIHAMHGAWPGQQAGDTNAMIAMNDALAKLGTTQSTMIEISARLHTESVADDLLVMFKAAAGIAKALDGQDAKRAFRDATSANTSAAKTVGQRIRALELGGPISDQVKANASKKKPVTK
ncbi:hypothetical protein [Stenotrophomonas maltophilia]|uniref:hypothetical protein n=1 Tax=Stenotrophomonas maltophilia TaxID=40324 RepID=UPI00027A7349|nr:hypothetical protein [Stenotrophomonas maltophilia]AVH90256.1 hypothetical protein AL480_05185 [Stenotrophomonas maltophilia]EJP77133.1 hypothetical protein A1OC_01943 [Stenotrophomonas maltophilia Ab55555]ELE7120991.1 hypothetical protein [Stenotrophomonas maltophilia]MBN4954948.1 hypothetical protein [Stenotrophomonas maltophilia]UGB10695.1 hypothetical protein LQ331_07485 [Stenotrophomonas maltophilia]